MDINVNVKFDDNFVNALSDIAGCLAAVSLAHAGNTDAHLPEKTVELPQAPAEPIKKAEPKKSTKKKEEPLSGESVSPAKAKEINDAIKTPSKDEVDMKAKRAELKSTMVKASKEGKSEAIKELLHAFGVNRLSQLSDEQVEEALKKAGEF